MTLLDSNILLYAYNSSAPQQEAAAKWLSDLLTSGELIAIPWVTFWAFVRISTNPRIWQDPLSAEQAFGVVSEWAAQDTVVLLQPGPRHAELLERVVTTYQAAGSHLTDAVLAALALESGATVASTDQDFRRFAEIRWVHPLA